jgi:ubiquinone/menaquinone biosynthesis C-methylase UbiE
MKKQVDISSFYDNWALNYDQDIMSKPWHVFDKKSIHSMLDYNITSIIDIGSGTGRLLPELHKINIKKYFFIEQSIQMSIILKKKAKKYDNIECKYFNELSEINNLSTLNIDFCLLAYSISHFKKLSELNRIMGSVKYIMILLRNPDIHLIRKSEDDAHYVKNKEGYLLKDYYHSLGKIMTFFKKNNYCLKNISEFEGTIKLKSEVSINLITNYCLFFEKNC